MVPWWKLIGTPVCLSLMLISVSAGAAEINKAKIELTCREYALEDKVASEEIDAYVQQCTQDLIEIRTQENARPSHEYTVIPPAD